jgi:hypothetical protein
MACGGMDATTFQRYNWQDEWCNMVNWRQFTLSSVQTAMFTPDHSAFAGSRVVATILRQFGERFSGDMQVLPLPPGIPPEISSVVLKSSDGSQEVNAGPARFNCVWNGIDPDASLTLCEALGQCVEVLEYYVRETGVRVGRLALVLQRACPNEDPAQTLIRRFCTEESQKEPFNRSATFGIHNHKGYWPDHEGVDYQINSWVRCQCGLVEPEKDPTIVVRQDLNTMAADLEQCQFDADKIGVFFSMVCDEAEAIIEKYFPE